MKKGMKIKAIGVGLCLGASSSWGLFGIGDIVFDPSNTAQTTITATNTGAELVRSMEHLILFEKQMAEVVGEVNEIMAFANSLKGYWQFSYLLDSELLAQLRAFQREAEELQDWDEFQPGVEFSVSERVANVAVPTWDEMAEKDVKIQQAFSETLDALDNAANFKRTERQGAMDAEADKEREFWAKGIAATQGVIEEVENLNELMTQWAAFEVQESKVETEEEALEAVADDAAAAAGVRSAVNAMDIPITEQGWFYYEKAMRDI